MSDAIGALLAPLAPPPADLALPPGTIEGPPGWWEGFGAGLRVWTGPLYGWRDFGDLAGMPADTNAPWPAAAQGPPHRQPVMGYRPGQAAPPRHGGPR